MFMLPLQIFDGWVLKGEKFPSTHDHPLPPHERYTDYCSSTAPGVSIRSSQNVAMVFFRIHSSDSGFTLSVKKLHNPLRESWCTSVIFRKELKWPKNGLKTNKQANEKCQVKAMASHLIQICLVFQDMCFKLKARLVVLAHVSACVLSLNICAWSSINQGQEQRQEIEWEGCTCFPAAWQTWPC